MKSFRKIARIKTIKDGFYTSMETDKSSGSCYGYFKVEDGKITGIGEERGRDGGWIWFSDYKMPVDKAILDLKEWPKLYQLAVECVDAKLEEPSKDLSAKNLKPLAFLDNDHEGE